MKDLLKAFIIEEFTALYKVMTRLQQPQEYVAAEQPSLGYVTSHCSYFSLPHALASLQFQRIKSFLYPLFLGLNCFLLFTDSFFQLLNFSDMLFTDSVFQPLNFVDHIIVQIQVSQTLFLSFIKFSLKSFELSGHFTLALGICFEINKKTLTCWGHQRV